MLAPGAYLVGFVELALLVGAFGFAARRIRACLLPAWRGAPAWLAEIVIGVDGFLIVIAEALGTFGAFEDDRC